jgi:hypothetical protein
MRRGLLLSVLLGCLIVGVLPALAADTTVTAVGTSWQPDELAVMPGDTVTWKNPSTLTMHSLFIDGTQVQAAATNWEHSSTFAAREQPYEFHCSVHLGMNGRFFVNATGTVPPPTPTPSPSATATPTPTPAPTSTGGGGTPPPPAGGAPGEGPVAVTGFAVKATAGHFCTRRSRTCKHPGVVLSLDLAASDRVRVSGTLRRRPLSGGAFRRFGSVAFTVEPGKRRLRLPSRRRITPGRYELELKAGRLTRRVRFLVRPS